MVQVISAMAHHGYLEQPGGEAMLEFLVRQCALPSDAVRISWHLVQPHPPYGSVIFQDLSNLSVQQFNVSDL